MKASALVAVCSIAGLALWANAGIQDEVFDGLSGSSCWPKGGKQYKNMWSVSRQIQAWRAKHGAERGSPSSRPPPPLQHASSCSSACDCTTKDSAFSWNEWNWMISVAQAGSVDAAS